jgi:Ni,Fe-hydrogenase III large subunit
VSSKPEHPFIPVNFNDYLSKRNQLMELLKNQPISKLFSIIERENPFLSISHQIHLSEVLELINGTIVSDDIRSYRGLLLNLERVLTLFFIFFKVFLFFEYKREASISYNGYVNVQTIFNELWQFHYPWGLIRPGKVLHSLPSTILPKIQRIIQFQLKSTERISKTIESNKQIVRTLREVKLLTREEAETLGITGPILRSLGLVYPNNKKDPSFLRSSANNYLQYAFTSESDLWNLLRVCYAELLLAINRSSQLLKPFSIQTEVAPITALNGELSSSFPTTMGQMHLTIDISDDIVTYINNIPPEMVNMVGITKILSKTPCHIHPLILLFFDPLIPIIGDD